MSQKVLSYDLGGTKVAVGVVNYRGKILDSIRVPVEIQKGKQAVLKQLIELGKNLLTRHSEIKSVGIASAGPLDPMRGVLLDPTNFISSEGSWGTVPITQILKKSLKKPVYLENDAAAAILAEHWVGAAKGMDNAMILTLGTGLGTGIICNGELVRAGQYFHSEGGHITIRAGDTTAPCSCGNLGCAEAYLSGFRFESRSSILLKKDLKAREIADMARRGEPQAVQLFQEYSENMAIALHNYAVLFAPEVVIFTGSFAAAADLFVEPALEKLKKKLHRNPELVPKLTLSSLDNHAGLIGGGHVGFFRKPSK